MIIATTIDVEDYVYMFYRTVANSRGSNNTPEQLMSEAVVAYTKKLLLDIKKKPNSQNP